MSRRVAIVGGRVVSPTAARTAEVLVEDRTIVHVGEVERAGAEVVGAAA